MCSERRDDHVVGEPLGGDPAAVVADERDRQQPAPARLGERRAARCASHRSSRTPAATSPGRPWAITWRAKIASSPDVVGDRREDAPGPPSGRSRARGQPAGGERDRRRASIASVAEPPLPNASTRPPRVEARAQRGGRLAQLDLRRRRPSAPAARRPRSPSAPPSAHVARRPPQVVAPAPEKRVEEAEAPLSWTRARAPSTARGARGTRARAPRARGRASRRAPARSCGSLVGGSKRHSARRVPKPIVRQPARARARAAAVSAVLRRPARCPAARRAGAPARRGRPRRQRQRRQRALADDHRVDELDRDVPRVRARLRPSRRTRPAARLARSARPSGGRARAIRSASAAKNASPAGAERSARGQRERRHHAVARPSRVDLRRAASRAHASIPSPVRALRACARSPDGPPGGVAQQLRRASKSRWGSRSILLTTTSSHARNISGYFSGLSSPSVTERPSRARPRRRGTRPGRRGCRRSR